MKFLLDNGFNEDLIDKLRIKYEEATLEIFELKKDNVLAVIDYFKEIGITNISELIIYKIELFTRDIEEIKEVFDNYYINSIVEAINENIVNINNI